MHPAVAQGLVASLAFGLIGFSTLAIARLSIPGLTPRGELVIVAIYSIVMLGMVVAAR